MMSVISQTFSKVFASIHYISVYSNLMLQFLLCLYKRSLFLKILMISGWLFILEL